MRESSIKETLVQMRARISLMTGGKIAVGSVLAMLAAQMLGLDYTSSAGIITLLSIMNTRKETLAVAGKRCVAFLMAMVLANGLFLLLGYEVWVYGLFLFFFYLAVNVLKVKEGFSMSAVLVTHLLAGGSFRLAGIGNEACIFVIGICTGILVNSYMPNKTGRIRMLQEEVEKEMRVLLHELAQALAGEPKSRLGEHVRRTGESLKELEREAMYHVGNAFSRDAFYFVRYVEMRIRQAEVLENMAEHIDRLTMVTPQAVQMSAFFEHVGGTFRESNNASELLEDLYELRAGYKESGLPEGREEFENRAVLFHVFQMMEYFLKVKKRFTDRMSAEEKARFWEGNSK